MIFKEHIHYDYALERAILGAIILEKTAFGRVFGLISPQAMYLPIHAKIFEICASMWSNSQPIDMVTVCIEYAKVNAGKSDNENIAYEITKITRDVCGTANLEYHALLLRQMHMLRRAEEITHAGVKVDLDVFSQLETIKREIDDLQSIKATDDFKTMEEIMMELLIKIENEEYEKALVTTGISTLDNHNGGFANKGLYILGARPSVGKSALMGRMAINAAKEHKKVAIISLEMGNDQIAARMASYVSGVDYQVILRDQVDAQVEKREFYALMERELSRLPIRVSDTPKIDINDIKSKVAKLKQRNQIDILFIDYIQLISPSENKSNPNREQQVAAISRGLKMLAMQYDIPVVVLAQLNRQSEARANKRPQLSDLRESGSLEQDADGVMFLHRDWVSGIKNNESGASTESEADIIVAKWRNGTTMDFKIGFNGSTMRFYESHESKFEQLNKAQLEETPF